MRNDYEKFGLFYKYEGIFDRAGFSGIITIHDNTAIKLHFGEWGNDGIYIRSLFARSLKKSGNVGEYLF